MTNYEIIAGLQKTLKNSRLGHSMGVACTAANLAMCHDKDLIDKAFRAGLLHDCAKYMKDDESIAFCSKHGIELSEFELATPGLIHAKMGVYVAENDYDEHDEQILSAIRWHTTGRPGMNMLEKLIFVADYIEPLRKILPNLNEIRAMAYKDLDQCIIMIYENTISYIKEKGDCFDPTTLEAYEYYKK